MAQPTPQASTTPPKANTTRTLPPRRWLILGILAASAVFIVVFVNNVIRVGKITEEIDQMRKEHQRLTHQNELYRAEIIRLQSPERITNVAKSRLGLIPSTSAPERIPAVEKK